MDSKKIKMRKPLSKAYNIQCGAQVDSVGQHGRRNGNKVVPNNQ